MYVTVAITIDRKQVFGVPSSSVVFLGGQSYALDLLIDGETGVRHLANRGAVSWAEFARRLARALDLDADLVVGVPGDTLGQAAPRPTYAALGSRYGALMPTLDSAIARFAAAVRPTLNVAAVKPPPARATAPIAPRPLAKKTALDA